MKTIKTPKGTHNRCNHGSWDKYGTKEERKANRRLFKSIRHKLLMCIPLTAEETNYRKQYKIEVNTPMRCDGRPLICY